MSLKKQKCKFLINIATPLCLGLLMLSDNYQKIIHLFVEKGQ